MRGCKRWAKQLPFCTLVQRRYRNLHHGANLPAVMRRRGLQLRRPSMLHFAAARAAQPVAVAVAVAAAVVIAQPAAAAALAVHRPGRRRDQHGW